MDFDEKHAVPIDPGDPPSNVPPPLTGGHDTELVSYPISITPAAIAFDIDDGSYPRPLPALTAPPPLPNRQLQMTLHPPDVLLTPLPPLQPLPASTARLAAPTANYQPSTPSRQSDAGDPPVPSSPSNTFVEITGLRPSSSPLISTRLLQTPPPLVRSLSTGLPATDPALIAQSHYLSLPTTLQTLIDSYLTPTETGVVSTLNRSMRRRVTTGNPHRRDNITRGRLKRRVLKSRNKLRWAMHAIHGFILPLGSIVCVFLTLLMGAYHWDRVHSFGAGSGPDNGPFGWDVVWWPLWTAIVANALGLISVAVAYRYRDVPTDEWESGGGGYEHQRRATWRIRDLCAGQYGWLAEPPLIPSDIIPRLPAPNAPPAVAAAAAAPAPVQPPPPAAAAAPPVVAPAPAPASAPVGIPVTQPPPLGLDHDLPNPNPPQQQLMPSPTLVASLPPLAAPASLQPVASASSGGGIGTAPPADAAGSGLNSLMFARGGAGFGFRPLQPPQAAPPPPPQPTFGAALAAAVVAPLQPHVIPQVANPAPAPVAPAPAPAGAAAGAGAAAAGGGGPPVPPLPPPPPLQPALQIAGRTFQSVIGPIPWLVRGLMSPVTWLPVSVAIAIALVATAAIPFLYAATSGSHTSIEPFVIPTPIVGACVALFCWIWVFVLRIRSYSRYIWSLPILYVKRGKRYDVYVLIVLAFFLATLSAFIPPFLASLFISFGPAGAYQFAFFVVNVTGLVLLELACLTLATSTLRVQLHHCFTAVYRNTHRFG